jgi:hypothetical protein
VTVHAATFARRVDWKLALDAYVEQHRAAPFDWCAHTCASFAAGWVLVATGADLDVPQPADALQAARLVDAMGGLFAEVTRQLGDALPGLFAQSGDVVLVRLEAGEGQPVRKALGVCLGACAAAPGASGLLVVPITHAEAAWRV